MLEGDTAGWQRSIDRARGQAHAAFRRAQSDLARLRKEREQREQNEPNSEQEPNAEVEPKTMAASAQNEPNSDQPSASEPITQAMPASDTKRTQFPDTLRRAA
jgi:hypothetical protein